MFISLRGITWNWMVFMATRTFLRWHCSLSCRFFTMLSCDTRVLWSGTAWGLFFLSLSVLWCSARVRVSLVWQCRWSFFWSMVSFRCGNTPSRRGLFCLLSLWLQALLQAFLQATSSLSTIMTNMPQRACRTTIPLRQEWKRLPRETARVGCWFGKTLPKS